jgi:diguanylate cyclase (GGDEF)-like protein/PAS domain S-box-containing protein
VLIQQYEVGRGGFKMKWLSNLSIRFKFLLLPAIAILLLISLSLTFLAEQKREYALLVQIERQQIPKTQMLSRLFSDFSTNHVRFISLLASALKENISESELYTIGRNHISVLNNIIKDLDKLELSFELAQDQAVLYSNLQAELATYRDQMGSTVLMSSVKIDLIVQFMLRANESYDQANTQFLVFIDNLQTETEQSVINARINLDSIRNNLFTALGSTLFIIIVISFILSQVFLRDIKGIIARLSGLANGNTNIPIPQEKRKDEFGAVNHAFEVFRDALIKRDEVKTQLCDEINRRAHTEMSLRQSEERFRALYEDNPLILFTIDEEGQILSINRRGAAQFGFSSDELVDTSIFKLVILDDVEDVREMIEQCTRASDTRRQLTLRMIDKDGNIIWLRETGQAINGNKDSKNFMILLACEDVTEAQSLSAKLSHQSKHDELTDLVNRREFEQRVIRALETAKSEKKQHMLCYLDLDQFKIINDTYGHAAGDQLLLQISKELQKHIRAHDTLARLGGDEFGILFEYCSMSAGLRCANDLIKAIEAFRFPWGSHVFRIGSSIGIVEINELSVNYGAILSEADTACYLAKELGGNRIQAHEANSKQLAERKGQMLWANKIPKAIETSQFELYYQTISPLSNDDNIDHKLHIELLIRLRNEHNEIISPIVFLPAAERYHLSSSIDKWVVERAFSMLNEIKNNALMIEQCSINLSGTSIGNADFLNFLLEKVDEFQIQPNNICFEITETAIISNLSAAKIFIQQLRNKGFKFALDDFGTGLSSYEYLKELPVDKLKIDGVFIKGIDKDPINFAMVKSINEIGHVMGLETIAEFVETKSILDTLKNIQVDYVQGYYISKPQPFSDIASIEKLAHVSL